MDEYNKYAALANTIKVKDITSCERKQDILQWLKDNDPSFDKLWICTENQIEDFRDYSPDSAKELAWLGYYLGQCISVKDLYIRSDLFNNSGKEVFFRGLGKNKSIHELNLEELDLLDGKILRMLDQFLKNNNNLTEIDVNDCQLGAEGIRQLSLVIGNCNRSLKHFLLHSNTIIGDGHLAEIITALSMHPQLMKLCLSNMNMGMGQNECTALSTLLRCTTTKLQVLTLTYNNMDDEGVEVVASALVNLNQLKELNLGCNRSITIRGWRAVASLLELSSSSLKKLNVDYNNIGNEGAIVFANALVNNSTLESLEMRQNGITEEGWTPFSRLLCDASSVNNTYMSNHTLGKVYPTDNVHVKKYLVLNKRKDKQQVAMSKILQHYSHFDMQHFFEWEFKVLPIMIAWFAKASPLASAEYYEEKINKMKLSVVYDFFKEFPMLYIESVSRKQIAEYTAMEEQLLQGGQMEGEHQGQLEEIRRCKARAMRRL